jgi:xanthine dehydrogenase accessory factor
LKGWLAGILETISTNRPAVLVTIADAKGSSPREAGVKMMVTADNMAGTVGGGNLEHEAIRIARQMLHDNVRTSELRRFALGPSLGQCCGGDTQLLFEPVGMIGQSSDRWGGALQAFVEADKPCILVSAIDGDERAKFLVAEESVLDQDHDPDLLKTIETLMKKPGNAGVRLWTDGAGQRYLLEQNPGHRGHILLLGAGHVGKALAHVLSTLPFAVTWADNRPEQYPSDLPPNIRAHCTQQLDQAIDEAPEGTIYLVMTYSHDLDYALCARILQRGDFRYLGLIGSKTKRARFEKTMRDIGIEQALIDQVVCPIGLDRIKGKQPAVIAVATAAQLLSLG